MPKTSVACDRLIGPPAARQAVGKVHRRGYDGAPVGFSFPSLA